MAHRREYFEEIRGLHAVSGVMPTMVLPCIITAAAPDANGSLKDRSSFYRHVHDHTLISASGVLLPCQHASNAAVQPAASAIPSSQPGITSTQGVESANGSSLTCMALAPLSLLWPFLMHNRMGQAWDEVHNTGQTPALKLCQGVELQVGLQELQRSRPNCLNLATASMQCLAAGTAMPSHGTAAPNSSSDSSTSSSTGSGSIVWLPARVAGCMCVPEAAAALDAAVQDVSSGSGKLWQLSWGLKAADSGSSSSGSASGSGGRGQAASNPAEDAAAPIVPPMPPAAHACMVLMQVEVPTHVLHPMANSWQALGDSLSSDAGLQRGAISTAFSQMLRDPIVPQPGQMVHAVGSPFGCLAPSHFANSFIGGTVSLLLPRPWLLKRQRQQQPHAGGASKPPATAQAQVAAERCPAVFILDAHTLPGMEGGLVMMQAPTLPGSSSSSCSQVPTAPLGLLTMPLRRDDAVQLQLAVAWPHVLLSLLQQPAWQQLNAAGGSTSGGFVVAQACSSTTAGLECLQLQPELLPQQQQQQPMQRLAVLARHITAGAPSPSSPESSSGSSSSLRGMLPPRAADGVVMIRARGSWASGVLVTKSGIILTNAHLLGPVSGGGVPASSPASTEAPPAAEGGADECCSLSPSPSSVGTGFCAARCDAAPAACSPSPTSAPHQQQRSRRHQQQQQQPGPRCTVRVQCTVRGAVWVDAQVLYSFRSPHLDLAVLQLDPVALQQKRLQLQPLALPAAARAAELAAPGAAVYVVGHGLLGPAVGWPAAVTSGHITKVVHLPDGRPSMMMTTAAVHAGASGGAVLSPCGRLLGIVTSNARHSTGATLAHLNFSITVADIAPVVAWAQQQQQQIDSVHTLLLLDVPQEAATRVWHLQSPEVGQE